MGKSSPEAAPPRDLAKELSQIISQGPALFNSEQQLAPGQTGLDLSNLNLALEGAPAGTKQVPYATQTQGWRNTKTGEFSATKPASVVSGIHTGLKNQNLWQPYTQQGTAYNTVDTPATKGLYDILGTASTRIGDITNQANTASRAATYADLRSLNPEQAGLYDLLAQDAKTGLQAGDRLTPDQQFNVVNPVRSNWAARGLGNSAPAQLDEAVNLVQAGSNMGQQRRTNAASTAQLGSSLYTLPAMSFAPNNTGNAQNFLGFGQSYGNQPNILQQLGGYGSDLFNTNFNATSANNINKANADNANTAAAAGTAIALLSAFCWAAREVYGAHDPNWLRFRRWMLEDAPEKFRNWYCTHGPQWAERLAGSPFAKSVVRRWMDRRLKGS